MQHLDRDRMVHLALFDIPADAVESAHLIGCRDCRAEMSALEEVADLGTEAQELRDLPPPPDRVWAAIEAGIAQPARGPARPRRHPRRRGRRTWLPPLLLAAASVAVAIAGTLVVMRLMDRPAPFVVTARATLTPLSATLPGAGGLAEVVDRDTLRVDVSRLPLTSGYYEVWLLNPDAPGKMQALGGLPAGSEALLPIPPGTDLNTYRLVDVSAEPHDGDSSHSGASVLRGTLTH